MASTKKLESIVHIRNTDVCLICTLERMRGRKQWTRKAVHWHHIFGGPNRKLSEKYGLKVHLCMHHHTGDIDGTDDAVHFNRELDQALKRIGQMQFERIYPELDFLEIFGRNYLEDDEHPEEWRKLHVKNGKMDEEDAPFF